MSRVRTPILYLAPWVDFGGTDKGTIDWFRWLDRSRFVPYLITTQPSSNRRLVEVEPYAEEVWSLPDLMVGNQFPHFIVDFIGSRGIKVLHIMNSRMGFDLLPDIRSLENSPKVVVQLHVEEDTRDGYVRYVTTRYGNLVDGFSISSEHLADAVHGYGIPRDRISVIPTGVDGEQEFNPDLVTPRPGLDPDLVHILYPGRLVEQKDPLAMVEVARELHTRGLPFRIHVVGGGDLEPVVRERVAAHGLSERVAFEPATNDLSSWYAAADLLLMTSVFEGVPYVLYEALAMRVPAVAPALPGNVELMGDAGGRLVAQRDEPGAYADALEPLIHDAELRERIGDEGRSLVLEGYTLLRMADRHAELYDGLLGGSDEPSAPSPQQSPEASAQFSFATRPSRGTPLVSVVTPCFNHGQWLPECVEGVRAQTYAEVEMIVVDDGSTELDTISYLEQLAGEPDVRVLRMERNSGPSAARNHAIEHATGRYILPVDADNVLFPDAIERLVAQLQSAGEHVGYIYPSIQYFGNREDYFEPPAFNAWLLTRGNYIDTCALLDREIFDHGLTYPEDVLFGHEDWDFFLTLAEHGVHGEPARNKTLRFRKHGFTRSDLVHWSGSQFHTEVSGRHPTMFDPEVKSRWAPALSVVTLLPTEVESPAWDLVLRGVARQRFRDFELFAATDGTPPSASGFPPIHAYPQRRRTRPAEAFLYALEVSCAPFVVVTRGAGLELLADPGSLERLVRLLDVGDSSRLIGLADDGDRDRFSWSVLSGRGRSRAMHSLAWSRRHEELRELPEQLDLDDPIESLAYWHYVHGREVGWRHLPELSATDARPSGRVVRRAVVPRSRNDAAEREARLAVGAYIPSSGGEIPRWAGMPAWAPAATEVLVRHRKGQSWVTTIGPPPPGFEPEYHLGLLHMTGLEGTVRIVTDPDQGYRAVERGAEPDSEEMERTLGYAEQVSLPLLEPLMLSRHRKTGAPVLVCGEEDPLHGAVEEIARLGFIDRWPVNPRRIPTSGATTGGLHGLVRVIDYAERRHRIGLDQIPPGERSWELGAPLDHDPGGGIPAWVDGHGRLHTRTYTPNRAPLSVRRTLRWAAAPASWREFGRHGPRARAVLRRSVEAVRHSVDRPRVAPEQASPQAWLLPAGGPNRVPILSAIHPVTGDQLVTRDRSEARELGYEAIRVLGYAVAVAPVTGTLARPRVGIPWGSRFGEVLSRAEEPLPWAG